jgi:alkylation response protein AidB-like acyl-CoA dehydrogenase
MTLSRAELADAAQRAFDPAGLAPDADESWNTMAEMGWLAICVAEERGGLGQPSEARAVIHHALGRALVPGPALAQMMAIDALACAEPSMQTDDLLARAMAGEPISAALAFPGRGDLLEAVPDADSASHVLRIEQDRVSLIAMSTCAVERRDSWDETRRLFDVRPGADQGLVLTEGKAAEALAETVRRQMLLSLAADSIGGAEAVLAMTLGHLATRQQFDRPLAMFQALKHRCAELRVAIGLADALLWHEAKASKVSLIRAGALKAQACSVYKRVAEEAIQLHGGIGLTVEHACHLFLKRALLNCALGGDADYWEEQAGRTLLAGSASA